MKHLHFPYLPTGQTRTRRKPKRANNFIINHPLTRGFIHRSRGFLTHLPNGLPRALVPRQLGDVVVGAEVGGDGAGQVDGRVKTHRRLVLYRRRGGEGRRGEDRQEEEEEEEDVDVDDGRRKRRAMAIRHFRIDGA